MINQNDLAQLISESEMGQIQVNIAQIKEVQKYLLQELSKYSDEEILELINKIRKNMEKTNQQ